MSVGSFPLSIKPTQWPSDLSSALEAIVSIMRTFIGLIVKYEPCFGTKYIYPIKKHYCISEIQVDLLFELVG